MARADAQADVKQAIVDDVDVVCKHSTGLRMQPPGPGPRPLYSESDMEVKMAEGSDYLGVAVNIFAINLKKLAVADVSSAKNPGPHGEWRKISMDLQTLAFAPMGQVAQTQVAEGNGRNCKEGVADVRETCPPFPRGYSLLRSCPRGRGDYFSAVSTADGELPEG